MKLHRCRWTTLVLGMGLAVPSIAAADDAEELPEPMTRPLTAAETRATEWLSMDIGLGLAGAGPGLGGGMRAFTFRWEHVAWSVFDMTLMGKLGDLESQEDGNYHSNKGLLNFATRLYYPSYHGPNGSTQIWYGLGVGWLLFDDVDENAMGAMDASAGNTPARVSLSPSVDRMIQWGPMLNVGVGLKAVVGLGPPFEGGTQPFMLLGSFHIGFTPGNVISRASAEASAEGR